MELMAKLVYGKLSRDDMRMILSYIGEYNARN